MNKNKEIITSVVSNLIGMPARNVKLGHGSFITMGFGHDREVEITLRGKIIKKTSPEWFLWVVMAAWRIDKDDKPFCGSQDSREKIAESIAWLEGKELTGITIVNNALDVQFHFGHSIALNIPGRCEEWVSWMLWTPDNNVLSILAAEVVFEHETA